MLGNSATWTMPHVVALGGAFVLAFVVAWLADRYLDRRSVDEETEPKQGG